MSKVIQPPNALLDYEVDWTKWTDTDPILTSQFSCDLDAITVTDGGNTDATTTLWVDTTGPDVELGQTFEVANHITTSGGRVMTGIIQFAVKKIVLQPTT